MTTSVIVKRRGLSRYTAGQWALGLCLLVVACIFLVPFLWIISTSFRTAGDLSGNPSSLWPTPFTWQNYIQIWSYTPLARDFLNSLVFAGSVTVLSVLLDSAAGYAFARYEFKGKRILFVLVLITLMVPMAVTFIPVYQFISQVGWLDTFQGLIVPRAADAFGIFFFQQYFLSFPRDLEDAARIDGANEFRIYFRIMMPLAGPALLTIGLFNFLGNWNDLLWPLMISTSPDMQTLPAALAQFSSQHGSYTGMIMAGSVMALLPVVVLFLVVQRRFVEGIATTGVK